MPKVSELTDASTLTGAELLMLVQSTSSKKVSLTNLLGGIDLVHKSGNELISGVKTNIFPSLTYGYSVGTENHEFEPGVYVDHIAVSGINVVVGGTRVDTSRAAVWLQYEDLYRQNSSSPYGSEWHLNMINPTGGGNRRPLAVFMQHSPVLNYLDMYGRVAIYDTPGIAAPKFIFEEAGAFRITNGAYMEISTAAGSGTDAVLIAQRVDGGAYLQDLQLLRLRADGNVGFGTWNQFGSGTMVIGLRNASVVPSTSPTGGLVYYSNAGLFEVKASDGLVDALRPAQPTRFIFRSAIDYTTDSAFASIPTTREYVAFWVEDNNRKVNRILFEVGVSHGNVDVSIMASDGSGGAPGTRIVSSGSTACPAAGAAAVTVTETNLTPGKYFACLASDSATATFRYGSGVNKLRGMGAVRYTSSGFPISNPEGSPTADTSNNVYSVMAAHT